MMLLMRFDFEELHIASHVNADLDELRMGIDTDTIGFGLLDFDAFFQDDGLKGIMKADAQTEQAADQVEAAPAKE